MLEEYHIEAIRAVVRQGRKSIRGGSCRYRGPDGLKCAVGHLIKDEYYSEEMEGKSIHVPMVRDAVANSLGIPLESVDFGKLILIQRAHDASQEDAFLSDFEQILTDHFSLD